LHSNPLKLAIRDLAAGAFSGTSTWNFVSSSNCFQARARLESQI